ncbi:MAG: DUF2225 domain-containing protein [Thermincola sp.]|jgi:uncharacterized protein (DUF2225 family)|nr:DUF2225 domain-containing protein [Thermincola sp.]MDT3703882.1 DUF2225 domain-containing protein [Thermincola sp.]
MTKNPFFEQQKQCPVCNNKFTVTRVRSSACFVIQRETDFHVKYRDLDPLLYSIWVCPNCQYANTDKEFVQDFKPHELERLKKGLSLLKSEEPDLSGARTLPTALRALELAIRTAMIRQAPAIVQAGLYLRSSWLMRDLGKTREEVKYAEQAKKLYQQSFEKEWGHVSAKMSDARIMYLIGELNRRMGNNEEAIKWFSRTMSAKAINLEPEIKRLVRDQWETAREDYKKLQLKPDPVAPALDTPPSPAPVVPPADTGQVHASAKSSRGAKIKMFLNLYMDQINWLKSSANKIHDKHKIVVEKEMVIRAIIDAVMEKMPDLDDFKSEEELKHLIMKRLNVD